jgi:hypothetical protein
MNWKPGILRIEEKSEKFQYQQVAYLAREAAIPDLQNAIRSP